MIQYDGCDSGIGRDSGSAHGWTPARLTPIAENLMKQYRRLQSIVQTETDEVYENLITDHLG